MSFAYTDNWGQVKDLNSGYFCHQKLAARSHTSKAQLEVLISPSTALHSDWLSINTPLRVCTLRGSSQTCTSRRECCSVRPEPHALNCNFKAWGIR